MKTLKDIFHHDNSTKITLPQNKPDSFSISFSPQEYKEIPHESIEEYENGPPELPFFASEVHQARVIGARILCEQKEGFKAVYELSFDVENTPIADNFNPGDTIGVIPKNRARDVDLILNRLELNEKANLPYVIANNDTGIKSQIPKHVPIKSTVRNILTNCLELGAVVKKLFIRALATHCKLEEERRCLEFMCSKEGSQLYIEHVLNKNISVLDILREFTSCRPTLACLLAYIPRLLPRSYSIVNSRLINKNVIKICFSVAEISPGKFGLVTEWLEKIAINSAKNKLELNGMFSKLSIEESNVRAPIYLKRNVLFIFPNVTEKVILIGPGTGVGPYIGYLENRMAILEKNPSVKLAENWLFFGCRDGNVDHIYKEELERFLEKKVLTRMSCAFSRVDNDRVKYVQDAIKLHSKEVSDWITSGAYIFVCGDLSVMAKQVEEVLMSCVESHAGLSRKEVVDLFKRMEKEKKYCMDPWS